MLVDWSYKIIFWTSILPSIESLTCNDKAKKCFSEFSIQIKKTQKHFHTYSEHLLWHSKSHPVFFVDPLDISRTPLESSCRKFNLLDMV